MATDTLLNIAPQRGVIKGKEELREITREVKDTKRGIKRDTKEADTRKERGPRQLPKVEATAGRQGTRVQVIKEDGREELKVALYQSQNENATNAGVKDTSLKTVQGALMR